MNVSKNEKIYEKKVRFRTFRMLPLTGAIESNASNLEEIVLEILNQRLAKVQGRVIDKDDNASMEQKKKEGYF